MNVVPGGLEGLLVIEPRVFSDNRGFFFEPYNAPRFRAAGIDLEFAQDNHSRSRAGVLRGLHFQTSPGQAKLVRCSLGRIWDVAVDIRPESPTLGRWWGLELDAVSHRQLFIPVGFAHGFCVLSEEAEVQYKCSSVYDPVHEAGIAWDDPEIAVAWPIREPLVSDRDKGNPTLAACLASRATP